MADRLGTRLALLAAFVAALVVGVAGGSAASSACIAPGDGPRVCLDVVHEPDAVTVARPGAPTYASFTATVRNDSKQTVTHVMLRVTPIETVTSEGFVLFSATPSAGTCSYDAASSTLTCSLGKLARGARARVELVVEAPSSTGEAPLDFIASFDERVSDNPESPGKVDTVSVTEKTSITPPGRTASTFVPAGVALGLSAFAGGQSGEASIPSDHAALTAALAITDDPPFVCPKGEICRRGDWVGATIPGNFAQGLRFLLHWPDEFVSAKQTEKNFVLFYIACDTCRLEIIRTRCSSATPALREMPCLWNVRDLRANGFEATLISPHNGKMH
jgi:hypothetical protein